MGSVTYLDRTRFGEIVRHKREAAGMSQRELARRLRKNPSYINRIEAGTRMPRLEVVVALAAVLKMDSAVELVDAMVSEGDIPGVDTVAMDVARFMRDDAVPPERKRAVRRVIETTLRVG